MTEQRQINWANIIGMSESDREAKLVEIFHSIAKADEESRQAGLKAMMETALAQPPDKFRAFTKSRLKALVKLEHDSAKKVAVSDDEVVKKMAGDIAFRRVAVARAVTKELTAEEQHKIRKLSPQLIDPEKRVMPTAKAVAVEKKPRFGFLRR